MNNPGDGLEPDPLPNPVGTAPGVWMPFGDKVVAALPGGGEARPGQRDMAVAVAGAIAGGRHLVVRAGTGTGKSLAYLLPAVSSGRKVVVATASLELGLDIGFIDLVIQLGSPRSIATFLQRVGRSGHALAKLPKGRIFPLTRDELLESAGLLDAVRHGALERLEIPAQPLDILSQIGRAHV